MIQLKHVYEQPTKEDGERILVDRLWPRGLSKERAAIDQWLKDLAPSTELRRWFGHDPARWEEFQHRYALELAEKKDIVDALRALSERQAVTLVYAAKDPTHNNAVALAEFLAGVPH